MSFSNTLFLIVDDQEINRKLITYSITKYSKQSAVLEACNGAEAFNLLKVHCEKHIILFTDINMPIMDGFRLIQLINQNKSLFIKGIEIIVVSSIVESNLPALNKLNVSYYLQKPARLKSIENTLEKISSQYANT